MASEAVEEKTPYELLGGDDGVRKLTADFYELMDTLPEDSYDDIALLAKTRRSVALKIRSTYSNNRYKRSVKSAAFEG